MVDHISRKVWILLTLLTVSVIALWSMGFRMGLDLQGGTRLVYSVDFDKALAEGAITDDQHANQGELMKEIIEIWMQRVDPQGVKGVVIREEGVNRVVIELPTSAAATSRDVSLGLDSEVGLEDVALYLEKDETQGQGLETLEELYEDFPATGGLIQIDGERIRYTNRVGNRLEGLDRGAEGSDASAHTADKMVVLLASDPWRQMIENTGSMNFYIEAKDADLRDPTNPANSTDLLKERAAVVAWKTANPNTSVRDYNRLLAQRPGPVSRLRWFPETATNAEQTFEQLVQPLIIEEDETWRFSGSDFPTFFQSQDTLGLPAVGFGSIPEKARAFGNFTEHHEEERMAIVINEKIVTFPNINSRLEGSGIIEGGAGGFTSEEVNNLVKILRSGSLVVRPDFEAQETVGASLGSDYVKRGFTSAITGLILVLIFMLFYYKRLGVLAGIALVFNLVILLGAMSFIQATLTLPGVAGIILTVGMAVDANILIYERIREEALRGRKPMQSAKDGFKNAVSTIVDANVTTLIVGLILYKFGTGAVRGFATTLCIGIITSMISALMLTRLLVHFALERGVDEWKMMRLVSKTNFDFIGKARAFVPASVLFTVLGLTLFIAEDSVDKYGIEFTGGNTATVRVSNAMPTAEMRKKFDPASNELITGRSTLTDSIQVQAITNSGNSDDGYNVFRLTSKDPEGDQDAFRRDILTFLEPVLEKGPVEAFVEGDQATGLLYFEEGHPVEDITKALAENGNLVSPTITLQEGSETVYAFAGTVSEGKAPNLVASDIQSGLAQMVDAGGSRLILASPIPELSSVGAQVVEELRDKAMLAIILSLFAAVMYIRVRFAEYSYGFAAVIALVHDVSLTLGALGVMIWTGWIRAEIDLPMIAAFLTIIGYSLNDTIVVFDRVRENLPRMKGDMKTVVNRSINQTLSRTLLTSVTTLISVTLLFAFNVGTRNIIEAFSFAMIVGVLVGTYSSMFIASPALVWLETRRQKGLEAEAAKNPEAAKATV